MRHLLPATPIVLALTLPAFAHLTGEASHDGAHAGQLVLIALALVAVVGLAATTLRRAARCRARSGPALGGRP